MRKTGLLSGLVLGLGLMGGGAQAAEVFLCTGKTTVTMPDGTAIPMWGYALDDNANLLDGCGANPVQVPGPPITVPSTDAILTVHLRNDLPEATSLVISGQSATMAPVFFTDAQGRSRVHSFTHETPPNGGTADYVWNNFQPGSYVYQSGTHVATQVQMGLYGAANKDAAPGEAYTGVVYDQDVALFYSEIDPLLHGAIDSGTYGTAPAPTSTIDYAPKYFLVNGAPYSATTTPLAAGPAGTRTLLRLYNMSLRTIAPTLLGEHMEIVAEDGNLYPNPRKQYSVMLSASKTRDAILVANSEGTYPFYDRKLNLVNAVSAPGGFYSYLAVGAGAATRPTAVNDQYTTAEDTPITIAAPGVLANDTGTGLTATQMSAATQGTVALAADGSFTYTPSANYNGTASFSYTAGDGTATSNLATVSVNVTPVNDAPVTVADSYSGPTGTSLIVNRPGVLTNDYDVDGDTIRTILDSTTINGTLTLWQGGAFNYTPNPGYIGPDSFTYHAFDGTLSGNTVTVNLTITPPPNKPPVAVDDAYTTPLNTFIKLTVMMNDYDPDGALDWASLTINSGPTVAGNVATVNAKGNAIYFTPKTGFTGVDTVTYTIKDAQGAVSNIATATITVQ